MDFGEMLNGPAPAEPAAPVQPAAPELQQRVAGWQQVFEKLKDPTVQRGLLAFAQVTGGPARQGESTIGQLSRGTNAGVAAYDTANWQQQQLELEAQKAQQAQESHASQLLTAEQSRASSKTQQAETKQRIETNAELRPKKLEQIQLELEKATLERDAKKRENQFLALKQNFFDAVNAGGPVDPAKLSPVEKSWMAELEASTAKVDLMKQQEQWYSRRALESPQTGAVITQNQLSQTADDIKLTDPEISKMPDGPVKDALARLKAQGMTQSKAKALGNEIVSDTNAAAYLDAYRTSYETLPEKKKAKLSFEQYVQQEVNGVLAPDEFSKNPSLKAQILKGSKTPAVQSGTEVLQEQGNAAGYGGPVQPMPKSAAEAVDGTVYQTPRGLARWNAKTQKFVGLEKK